MSDPSYAQRSLSDYLKDAASGSPTPGGGSVSALVGALAASMSSMVANFTVGKKKYEGVQSEVKELVRQLEGHRAALLALVDEDIRDYSKVSSAYDLPKETEEEKMKRHAAIVAACRCALQTPLKAALEVSQVAVIASRLSLIGNKNLLTDSGVSSLLCLACAEAAGLNVEINLSQIPDEPFKAEVRSRLKRALDVTRRMRQEVWQRVLRELHCDVGSSLL